MWEFFNFYLVPGVVLGCIYGLGAVGISLTFAILRFANFAHGEILLLGTYLALTMVQLAGVHPLVALMPAMALTAVATVGIDRAIFKPLRASPAVILVIASFGLMLMIRSVVQLVWGVNVTQMTPGVSRPESYFGGALLLQPKHITIVAGAVVLMYATHLLLSRTKIGKAMRAVSDNPELARLSGIDTERVIRATWMTAAALATAAGVFLAIDTHVETMMGFRNLLPMFAAAILGGIGRPYGALAGGIIIGIMEEISSYPWIGSEPLLSPGYKQGVAFAIMVIMLIWRPSGLFRGRVF